MEDNGPDAADLLWAFTLGSPPDELMDQLAGMTESGNVDWLLVPIYNESIDGLR